MKKRLLLTLMVLLIGLQAVIAQSGTIRGKILDDKGEPIPGATIRVKGTNKGTVTDLNGNFKLNVEDGASLSISAIGMKATEKSAQDGMSVKMITDQQSLRETVVTAQAIKREKGSLGYATTTLNNTELNNGNNSSALSALTGKVSGVNITSTTGGPGGSTRVVIRGEKSIGGNNNALIVVDGVPINNGTRLQTNNLKQIDFGNRGNDINPEDIESISVLKGGAATVLYGSEGANGAIMITTKSGKVKGKAGKNEIGFTTGYSWSGILKYPSFQNQFGEGDLNGLPDDRRENFSWGLPFDGELRPWGQIINGQQRVKRYEAQENNVKDFFNIGKAWENNLQMSGGTEKGNYFISVNTLNNKGVIPNTFYDKYSFRINANHEFNNNFSSSINVNYINGSSRVDQGGQGEGSVWNNVCQQPRDIPIGNLKDLNDVFNSMDYTDSTGVHRYGYYGAYTENPYYVAEKFDNRNKFDRVIGQTSLTYKIGGHASITNRFGGELLADRNYLKSPKLNSIAFEDLWSGSPKSFNGGYTESSASLLNYFNDLMLNMNYQIDKLGINMLIGHSVSSRRSNLLSSSIDPVSNGLVIQDYYNFDNAKSKLASENTLTRSRKIGMYAQVGFDFDKMFFLELTGRNDWTSTLAASNRSYFYPGVSASWLFSQLLSDKVKKTLNYGKLRASVTSVGNDASAYDNNDPGFVQTEVLSGFGSNIFPFNGVPGFSVQDKIGNNALKNERSVNKEIGLEMGFMDDRLTFDFTVYTIKSRSQIFSTAPVSPASGYNTQVVNGGLVQNKGFEAGLRFSPIKRKGIKWELYGTYSRNKNIVLELPDGVDPFVIYGFSGMNIVAAKGLPYGTFYALDLMKDANGNQIIDSATGAPKSTSAPVLLGSFQPKFIASWGTGLTVKGFNLNILFDTKQGGYLYSRTKDILEFVGVTPSTTINDRQPFLWNNSVYENSDGDLVPNTSIKTDVYNYYTAANVKPAGQDLIKSGYIKLREISIGYKLPQKWFSKTFIGSGNIALFGNNLLIWTNKGNDYIDPEVNSGGSSNVQGFDFSASPSIRNYGFKLGLTF